MNQFTSIYRSLSNVCVNNKTMNESQRSYFITITNVVREALATVILPRLPPELLDRLLTILVSTDCNLAAFGCYPRAVDMLLTQARRPKGPYEPSLEGENSGSEARLNLERRRPAVPIRVARMAAAKSA